MSSGLHNIAKKMHDSISDLFRYVKDEIVGDQSKSEQRKEANQIGE